MTFPALEVSHLTKRFGGLPATRDVSLSVMPGERRLIIGPNGAGKTTLFNLITGALTPDPRPAAPVGPRLTAAPPRRVALFARDLEAVPRRRRPHMGMARTYQIITLFPHARIVHNVSLALLGL